MRVPFLPLSPQYLLLFGFVMTAILTGVRWNLKVIVIHIYPTPMDVQHFKKYFLTIRISSSENSFQCIGPFTDSKPLSTAPHLLKTLISCSKHKFKFFFLYVFIRHKEAVNLFVLNSCFLSQDVWDFCMSYYF